MVLTGGTLRRLFVGKEVAIFLGVLLAGALLVPGSFVPAYLAVLLASGLRNAHMGWLGSGIPFYAVTLGVFYLQAVVLTALYHGLRAIYRAIRTRARTSASL